MSHTRPPHPAGFRQRMIELVESGCAPEALAQGFEPSAQTIRNWVVQAARDAGDRQDARPPPKLRNCGVFAARIGVCARNARF